MRITIKSSLAVIAVALLAACGGGGGAGDNIPAGSTPSVNLNPTQPVASVFVKVDGSGNQLPADSPTWSCTLNTQTGLLWEVKTDDGGLRDKDWVYTAYETTGANGNGVCDATKNCNQYFFKSAVNAAGLCGYKDWRLPQLTELESLQDRSQSQAPYINGGYFPFTLSAKYWTGSYFGFADGNVWWVDFASLESASTTFKDIQNHVRLVRP